MEATSTINNAIYSELGERWYQAKDDPIALLRAESRCRNPWIAEQIVHAFGERRCNILDVGCGAGFLANDLAQRDHQVVGFDASEESLAVAARHDSTKSVRFQTGDAHQLPFSDGAFDVVCAMDFLEHVDDPARVIAEAGRVLAVGGLFFFHTFNRNFLSWLVVIKGVEWFVKNTPREMHLLRMFLKPKEVARMCQDAGLRIEILHGMAPKIGRAFFKMLASGSVGDDFEFRFGTRTTTGYIGMAQKM